MEIKFSNGVGLFRRGTENIKGSEVRCGCGKRGFISNICLVLLSSVFTSQIRPKSTMSELPLVPRILGIC